MGSRSCRTNPNSQITFERQEMSEKFQRRINKKSGSKCRMVLHFQSSNLQRSKSSFRNDQLEKRRLMPQRFKMDGKRRTQTEKPCRTIMECAEGALGDSNSHQMIGQSDMWLTRLCSVRVCYVSKFKQFDIYQHIFTN